MLIKAKWQSSRINFIQLWTCNTTNSSIFVVLIFSFHLNAPHLFLSLSRRSSSSYTTRKNANSKQHSSKKHFHFFAYKMFGNRLQSYRTACFGEFSWIVLWKKARAKMKKAQASRRSRARGEKFSDPARFTISTGQNVGRNAVSFDDALEDQRAAMPL